MSVVTKWSAHIHQIDHIEMLALPAWLSNKGLLSSQNMLPYFRQWYWWLDSGCLLKWLVLLLRILEFSWSQLSPIRLSYRNVGTDCNSECRSDALPNLNTPLAISVRLSTKTEPSVSRRRYICAENKLIRCSKSSTCSTYWQYPQYSPRSYVGTSICHCDQRNC